ncbi:MAG: glycosyltransferase [Pseudomonadota bacterium]
MSEAIAKSTHNEGPGETPDVAILLPSYAGGGAEGVAFFLAETFAANGLDTELVVSCRHGPMKDRPTPGFKTVDLNAVTEILALPQWLGYLRRRRPRAVMSIVHTATLTAGLGNLVFRNIPVITTIHNAVYGGGRSGWWFRRTFGLGLERALYKNSARIVTVSNDLSRQVAQVFGWPDHRVETIYNAPMRAPDPGAVIDPAHEAIFSAPVILGIGRLEAAKDFSTLITAFAKIKNNTPANLLILGEGSERKVLEGLCSQLNVADRVFLPGFFDTPEAYLARADVFALTSIHEGFSLVCAEALASGVAIVATDCDFGPREVLDRGAFGALCPVGDADAVSNALKAGLEDERTKDERLSERRDQIESLSAAVMKRRYVDLVRSVLGAENE